MAEKMYKDIIKENGVDAILITDPLNMRYLSGFKGGEGILYLSDKRSVLVTDSRYTEAAGKESDFEVIEENTDHKRMQILSECIKADGALSIGFEDQDMSFADFQKYRKNLGGVKKWITLCSSVTALRMIKTDEEISYMQRAASIADKAFGNIFGLIKPGMTELEGAAELEYQMKKLGAEDVSFKAIFAAGKNSSMPHAVPTEHKVCNGEFITMDFGCKVNGYCSDMTRTVAVGEPSKEMVKVYDTVFKAQLAGLEAVKPGVSGREADKAARDIIKAAGYGEYFGHALGHSVGLFIHEEPRLSPGDPTLLRPGMIETVEPGIYIPGEFGVRIEDMVAVTEEGCRNFVSSPKELIIL